MNIEQDIMQLLKNVNACALRHLRDPKGIDIIFRLIVNHEHNDFGWCLCQHITYLVRYLPNALRNKFIDLAAENNDDFAGKKTILAMKRQFAPEKQIPRSKTYHRTSKDRKTRLCLRGYISMFIDRTIEEACVLKPRYFEFESDAFFMRQSQLCEDIL